MQRKGCQPLDITPVFLDAFEPFKATKDWFRTLAHDRPHGFRCVWSAMGIPMITNAIEKKLITPKRIEPFLRNELHLNQDFIDNCFIFNEGMISHSHQEKG